MRNAKTLIEKCPLNMIFINVEICKLSVRKTWIVKNNCNLLKTYLLNKNISNP
jgi:hypothetical protein